MCLTVGGDLTVRAAAEPWSGILDPSRAIDWSHSGIPGGIPNRTTICASLDPGSSAAQIDAAIAACPPNQVVFLAAGTFTLSAGLSMNSDVTLRGAGANRTKLVFTGTTQCDRGPPPYPVICFKGSFSWAGGVENSADWTAGYGKDTTVITLSNTANLRAGESFLILDQVDDAAPGFCGLLESHPDGLGGQIVQVNGLGMNANELSLWFMRMRGADWLSIHNEGAQQALLLESESIQVGADGAQGAPLGWNLEGDTIEHNLDFISFGKPEQNIYADSA